MLIDRSPLSADEIHRRTGWEIKPQGACRGDECVPLSGIDASAPVDIADFAKAMSMPLVHDEAFAIWALGRRSAGSVLESAALPRVVLDDFGGGAFDLASLRGRKVLLVAWASW